MGKISISDFEHFLRSKSRIKKKYIPYYAHWARNFLIFLNTTEPASQDFCVEKYLNYLNAQTIISDWQISQADDAVRLDNYNFKVPKSPDYFP